MKRLIGIWSADTPTELIDAQITAASGKRLSPTDLRALGVAIVASETGWTAGRRRTGCSSTRRARGTS